VLKNINQGRDVRLLLLLLLSIITAACGGGGGGSDDAAAADDVNGIWREPSSGTVGIISADGWNVDIIQGIFHYNGDLRAIRGDISSYLRVFAHGGLYTHIEGNGTLTPKAAFHADYYRDDGSHALTLDMTYDPISDRQPSFGLVSGIWSQTAGQYTLTITINSDGSLFGSDTDGCSYLGSVTIPDPNINIYKFHMLNDCIGSFADGQGIVIDTATVNDTLLFAIRGYYPGSIVQYSLTDTLHRQ
jgi:hypothetical protein